MSLTVTTIATRALELAPDLEEVFDSDDYAAEVVSAVRKISMYEPQVLYVDVTGDGDAMTFDLAGWLPSHKPNRLEYPIDDEDQESTAWRVVRSGATAWSLRLSFLLPDAEDARLWYTAYHSIDGSGLTTVDDELIEPVAHFTAARILRRLANRFSQRIRAESFGGAELVSLQSQAAELHTMAKTYDREALELLGVVSDDAAKASAGQSAGGGSVIEGGFVSPPWESIDA